jgi:hypothetical protein
MFENFPKKTDVRSCSERLFLKSVQAVSNLGHFSQMLAVKPQTDNVATDQLYDRQLLVRVSSGKPTTVAHAEILSAMVSAMSLAELV